MNIELIDIAFISENIPFDPNKDRSLDLGYLSLSEEEILFEFIRIKRNLKIFINEIQNILKKNKNGHDYIKIFLYSGKKYSFELIKKKLGKLRSSKKETDSFFNLVFMFKFKQIARKSQKKFPLPKEIESIDLNHFRPNYCFQCGHKIRDGAQFCSNCGYKINFLDKSPILQNQIKKVSISDNQEIIELNKMKEITEKLKNIIEISPLIRLKDLQEYLNLKQEEFYDMLLKWAKEFSLIIDGEYLITNSDSLSKFTDSLFRQYTIKNIVNRKASLHERKHCQYCNNLIESEAKICPYCGNKKYEFKINKIL